MARNLMLSTAMVCCLLLVTGVATAAMTDAAFVLRDDAGRDVAFAHSPRHIISLLPSLTETVCALGACDRLIATDRFSNWPSQVMALPKAGGLDDASVELLVALKPDLILLSRSQRITERLRELGVSTFALDTQTYADIGRTIILVGRILGAPDLAASLNRRIDDEVDAIGAQTITRRHGARPSVYYEVDRAPYAAGPQSFIGEMLLRLGTRNIVTGDLGPYPKLNPEYVVRQNPDVIFVAGAEAVHLTARPGWATIHAVRENHVCSLSPAVNDTVVRPGPRVAQGMRALAACLQRFSP